MLKFLDKDSDRDYTSREADVKQTEPLTRLRKQGQPRQAHVIPELPVIPWEDPRERYENRLIMWMNRR